MIIGTGIDITEVGRLRRAIEKWSEVFLNRVFTFQELEDAKNRGNLYRHLAGRFAAKEAVFKALGNPELNWKDIQILNDQQGRPYCMLLNGKGKKKQVFLSISHVKNYAVANAVIIEED